MMDYSDEYELAPTDILNKTHRRRPSEEELRALACALKASGLSVAGALVASGAASRIYAALEDRGFTVMEIDAI